MRKCERKHSESNGLRSTENDRNQGCVNPNLRLQESRSRQTSRPGTASSQLRTKGTQWEPWLALHCMQQN